MLSWSGIYLQDGVSLLMNEIVYFHDMMMLFLIMLVMGLMVLSISSTKTVFSSLVFNENQPLEFIWTLLPSVIMFLIAVPSIRIVYLTEDLFLSPSMTVKVEGHQWYWSYEVSGLEDTSFDSYMINENLGQVFRLLDVDNQLVLPVWSFVRFLVTSSDVIHSWTVPSLMVKVDAVPGRLNQVLFSLDRPGLYFGQCSEICGANHSFMPISIEGRFV